MRASSEYEIDAMAGHDGLMGTSDPTGEFAGRFGAAATAAFVDAEREALGSDYGGNGYTTVAQADDLGVVLDIGPGERLLDLGSGCGWPGLYLAARHGCEIVTADPVADGATTSVARSARDGLQRRHVAVIAMGGQLPFRSRSFDAIVHTDVMC